MARNERERVEMVRRYARHVRSLPDEEWSRQQNEVIDSMFQSAIQLDPRVYLKIKKEPCAR